MMMILLQGSGRGKRETSAFVREGEKKEENGGIPVLYDHTGSVSQATNNAGGFYS